MNAEHGSERDSTRLAVIFILLIAATVVVSFVWGGAIRRFVRESRMQRVNSAHYEILYSPDSLSRHAATKFASDREALFAALNKKLAGADSNLKIRIVFDPNFRAPSSGESAGPAYAVTGATIRTRVEAHNPQLAAAADSEAMLSAAWGKPGNPEIARWTAIWLLGEWRGAEIGMAAAQVEQHLGHKRLASVLADPGGEISSPEDRDVLGAAWISEVADFGGADAVKKIYAAKMAHPNITEVTKVLGTNPLELDRKWQMWMYSYLAGMPSAPQDSGMPMNMPMNMQMPGQH